MLDFSSVRVHPNEEVATLAHHMTKPVAGSFAFPAIKDPNGSISALCKEWVEEGNVMLLPSNLYDFDDKHFRLGMYVNSISLNLK